MTRLVNILQESCAYRQLPRPPATLPRFADEAALLAVFRESLAISFGDLGVSRSAMSLSGCQHYMRCVAD